MQAPVNDQDPLGAAIRAHRGRFRGLGLVLIALGALAILFPFVASIAVKLLVGWLLLISGAAVLWTAFQARGWSSALVAGLIGVLQIAAGVWLAFFPTTGLVGLTLIMGLMFLVQGAFEVAIAWGHRALPAWGWLVASGAASIVLGAVLVLGLPETALWALGLILGINLVSSGASFLFLARK